MTNGALHTVAALAGLLLATACPGRGQEVEVGEHFPDLTLPALDDGQLTRLSDLTAGRRVLLIQFASW